MAYFTVKKQMQMCGLGTRKDANGRLAWIWKVALTQDSNYIWLAFSFAFSYISLQAKL